MPKAKKTIDPMKIEAVAIDKILAYSKNAKKHPEKQIKQVAESIQRFGWAQPLVVDAKDNLVIGHCRLLAAKKMGLTSVPVMRMENLTKEEANALRLADNKLNESEWDMNLVIEELKDLKLAQFDIKLTGFDEDLIIEPGERDNDVPDVPKTAHSKLGDIYEMDGHRLICGDSTDPATFERLLEGKKCRMTFTDPPYNVDYKGTMNRKREGIKNDKMAADKFLGFLEGACGNIVNNTTDGIYICMGNSEIDTLKKAFVNRGGHWSNFIIWVKNNFTISRGDYQQAYEPMLYGWPAKKVNHHFIDRRDLSNVWEDLREVKSEFDGQYTTITFAGFKVRILGEVKKGEVIKKKQRMDVWRFNKPSKSAEHPTMKPVELVVEAITNSSEPGDAVLDTFLGSGTTLIACEKTGRKCFGIELDPKYADVIVERWEKYTGKKATLIRRKK